MSTPDLSEMESNAQKELKEMATKLTRLQNDIKIVSLLTKGSWFSYFKGSVVLLAK